MSNYKVSRRKFITSSGTVFTLPLLSSIMPFSKAMAQAVNDPKRYVVFYYPNGTCNRADRNIWLTNPGTLTSANANLAYHPFSANYGDLININYLVNSATDNVGGDDHELNAKAYLTCERAPTTSFENMLGDRWGKAALVLSGGVTNADLPADKFFSYRNGVGDAGISNPGDLYRRIYNQIVPPTAGPVSDNKSVLDSSIADFTSLNATLSKSDRIKMDEFLTAVRSLERSIASTTPTPTMSSCAKPVLDPQLDSADSRNTPLYIPKLHAMNDMIKIAFACDLTRSVSIMMDEETCSRQFTNIPTNLIHNGANINYIGGAHISISHGIETAEGFDRAVTRDRLYNSVVMDLVNKLKTSNDPSGSRMLDNTIIQAGFGIVDGNHAYSTPFRRPLMLAGGRNMLTGGMSYSYGSNDFKDLYYTLASKLGAGFANFRGSTTTLRL